MGSHPVKSPGGILLCVVKVQCLEEVGKYSTNKPAPGFAQSSKMGVSKPLATIGPGSLTTVFHAAVCLSV